MQTYHVELESPVIKTFFTEKAVNSVDLDINKKSKHSLQIEADLKSPYSVGLILGSSGSGKTTLAKHIFGDNVFSKPEIDPDLPIIEQFPSEMSYDERVSALSGVGLTQVPCWVRPVKTLSTGQKARAEVAWLFAHNTEDIVIVDEWTSTVDRTIAKIMSEKVQKFVRKSNRRLIVLACHYDILEWLNPDWVIDCTKSVYTDRRLLCRTFTRNERLPFDIRAVERNTWRYFSKYHYLSDAPPPGYGYSYGIFSESGEQIGFFAFNNYIPWNKRTQSKMILHANRIVLHPDYVGVNLGIKAVEAIAQTLIKKYVIRIKFSSKSMLYACQKSSQWALIEERVKTTIDTGTSMKRKTGFRVKLKTWSFQFKL